MKVSLIVVQGKPEGKEIPLTIPRFKIGRGETCNLRPNSEQVSREHAEFRLLADKVLLSDLGSKNGTLVNGKAITEATALKNNDLVQIGHLTFQVQIQDAPAAAAVAPPAAAPPAVVTSAADVASPAPPVPKPAIAKPASSALDDVSHDEIESWLVSDHSGSTPERPSGVYGGDTITIKAFRDANAKGEAGGVDEIDESASASDEEYERIPEGETADITPAAATTEELPEEFLDESNPFYVAKKKAAQEAQQGPQKPVYKDSSDAAQDILRKMMERRKASKS